MSQEQSAEVAAPQMIARVTDPALMVHVLFQPITIEFGGHFIKCVSLKDSANKDMGIMVQNDVVQLAFDALRAKTPPTLAEQMQATDTPEQGDPGDEHKPAPKPKKSQKAN